MEEIMHAGVKEMKDSVLQVLNDTLQSITKSMNVEYNGLRQQIEILNEDVKRIDGKNEQMSSGRFQHVFQKTELLRRQEVETYSKIVQLESTTTETNALVYELHQKVDSLKKAVQRATEIHRTESKNLSSEYMRIKEQIAVIKSCSQNPSPDAYTLKRQDISSNSKKAGSVGTRVSDMMDSSTSEFSMSEKSSEARPQELTPREPVSEVTPREPVLEVTSQEPVSEVMPSEIMQQEQNSGDGTTVTGESKGPLNNIIEMLSCEYNDTIYPFYPEEQGLKPKEDCRSFPAKSNRSLSPTLEMAIRDYNSDLLESGE
jgi:hypothetical protein